MARYRHLDTLSPRLAEAEIVLSFFTFLMLGFVLIEPQPPNTGIARNGFQAFVIIRGIRGKNGF